jgi:hypothetical protein
MCFKKLGEFVLDLLSGHRYFAAEASVDDNLS